MTLLLAILLLVAGYLFWRLFLRPQPSANALILKRFNLDPLRYSLLAADVGGHTKKIRLAANGVHGDPDAIIRARESDELIIGEVKSRAYRGAVRPYERYQVTLYLGAAHRRYPRRKIHGLICYSNRVIRLDYDDVLYRQLIALIPEYKNAVCRMRTN